MQGPFLLAIIRGWCDLPRSRRYAFCLMLIAANTALFLAGKLWFTGWAVGLVLLGATALRVGED